MRPFGLALLLAMPLLVGPGRQPPAAPERIEAAGVENLFRLSPRLYSGAQPEGEAGFSSLKALGIRTVVSVDGSQPNVEGARRAGLRYVHLPVGYDGIGRGQAVRLAEAVRTLPGPVFVHCHHGMHRGPAAAAVCAMAVEGWDAGRAKAWLERAGTDPGYAGLFVTVAEFTPPTAEERARAGTSPFPERAEAPGLVASMVEVDRVWDGMKAIEKAGFRAPADHPDLDPPHQARMLVEQFREAGRREEARARGEAFERALAGAEADAMALEAALRDAGRSPGVAAEASGQRVRAAFDRVARDCKACHAGLRDVLRP